MPIPRLLFPVTTVLQLLKLPGDITSDPDYGEPEESGDDLYVEDPENPGEILQIEIMAQWVPKKDLELGPVAAGDSPQALGYILVKTRDVEKKLVDYNGAFKKGDLIVTVGGEIVNAVIVEVENHSHYHGKPQLKFLMYENKDQR